MNRVLPVVSCLLGCLVVPAMPEEPPPEGGDPGSEGEYTYEPGDPVTAQFHMYREGAQCEWVHYAQLGGELMIEYLGLCDDWDDEYFDGELVGPIQDALQPNMIFDNDAGGLFWTPGEGRVDHYCLPDHKPPEQPITITNIENDVPIYADDPEPGIFDYYLFWGPAYAELKSTDNDYTTWLPQGEPDENSIGVKVRTLDNDPVLGDNNDHFVAPAPGTTAELSMEADSSDLPGVCSNHLGDISSDGPDFTWDDPWGAGGLGEPWEDEADGVLEATLDSHDWGGEMTVGAQETHMPQWHTPEGSFELALWVPHNVAGCGSLQIPYDPDGDNLPYGYEESPQGSLVSEGDPDTDDDGISDADEDEDYYPHHHPPGANGHPGDGFRAFDEYRGFRAKGVMHRGDLGLKQMYVLDEDGLGLGYHVSATSLLTYLIDETEWFRRSYEISGVINYNGDGNQYGVRMYDFHWGHSAQGSLPNQARVEIDRGLIDEYNAGGHPDRFDISWVIAHELGHTVNMGDDPPDAGATWVMTQGEPGQMPYPGPDQHAPSSLSELLLR